MCDYFGDKELPNGVIFQMLKDLPPDKESIILTSTKIVKYLEKREIKVRSSWAGLKLKKSIHYLPKGWSAKTSYNTRGHLRIEYKRIKENHNQCLRI